MKFLTRSLLLCLALMLAAWTPIHAQCTQGVIYGTGTALATCGTAQPTLTCHFINEYAQFNGLTIGNTYQIGNNMPGTPITTVTAGAHILTLYDGAGAVLTSQVNATNNLINITFVATTTTVRVQTNTYTGSVCGTVGNYCHYFGLLCTSCVGGPGAPACPTLSTPADNATGVSTSPTLTWVASTNAASYDVYLNADPTCLITPTTLVATVTTTSYIVTPALAASTSYRWMVIPKDCAGNALASCTVRCFTTGVAPPSNDECAGATSLTPSPNGGCVFTALTTAGASQSTPNPACTATANNDDVWYTFTTTAAGAYRFTFNSLVAVSGTATTLGMDVYTGVCGGLTTVVGGCSASFGTAGAGNRSVTLAAATTYYLRLFTGGTANSGTFNLCIEGPPPPPANDNCAGATAVTVNPTTTCTALTPGTVVGATTSAGPTSSCGTYDDDVWFSFVATSTVHTVTLQNLVGSTTDMTFQVLDACGAVAALVCSDPESASVPTVIGTTYYIRVATWSSTGGQTTTFNVCVATPPAPPANDACSGATVVTNGSVISMSTANATADPAANAPTCNLVSSTTNGVWFVFTAPANSSGTVTLLGCNTTYDTRVRVFTTSDGNCPNTGGNTTTCVVGDDNDDCSGPGNANAETTTFAVSAPAFGPHGSQADFAPVNYYIYMSGGSGTLEFSVGAVLPLELKSFTGQVQGNVNVLNWETLTEKNVRVHIVERSIDGTRWTEVGQVAGKGDSQVSVKYTLEDRAPLAKAYYRLRSVDFDGQENRSNTIVLTRKSESFGITNVYPSPTNSNVTVQFNATAEEEVTVRVMDMTGRLVMQQITDAVKDINELPITLTGLQAGVYSVTVSNSTGISAPVRFVKQ